MCILVILNTVSFIYLFILSLVLNAYKKSIDMDFLKIMCLVTYTKLNHVHHSAIEKHN